MSKSLHFLLPYFIMPSSIYLERRTTHRILATSKRNKSPGPSAHRPNKNSAQAMEIHIGTHNELGGVR